MSVLPKWNEERTNSLVELAGEGEVSQETVATCAEALETTKRSISSKLRKMGYDVELVSAGVSKTFSEEQAQALAAFLEVNEGAFTYSEIAQGFEDGKFSAKQIQGKILSMELTDAVKATPKAESVKTYSDDEEVTFIEMADKGSFLEEIAAAMGRELNSVRGKALSLLRTERITSIPKQRDVKGRDKTDALEDLGDVSKFTVEQLAEELGKTPRGVRTMLTRRGLIAADYDGEAKKAKASE